MGECNKTTTFAILDYFYESGGNFLDTANNYQREEAEQWVGEWMQKRGNRNQMGKSPYLFSIYSRQNKD